MSSNAHALFGQVYKRYNTSDRLNGIKSQRAIDHAQSKINENKYDWSLQLSAANSVSGLAGLYATQSQETSTNSYSLGLSKSSFKFGTLGFTHTQTQYDLSEWSAATLTSFSDEIQFESKNTLTYSYEILNDSLGLEWDIFKTQDTASVIEQTLTEQKDHFNFFNSYVSAKQGIMLDRLYNEFENRALQRVTLVKRRVRDGLSRSVDLNQSRLALLQKKETIINNTSLLREKIVIIEEIIGISITPVDYKLVNWTYKPKENYTYLFEDKKYLELEKLKLMQRLSTLQVNQFKEGLSHSLNLNISYSKNSFNEDMSKSITEATGNSDTDERIISLTYSMPIGLSKISASKDKLLAVANKNKLDHKNLKGEIIVQTKVVKENLTRYTRAIEIISEKIEIADKIVEQNYKLYTRGKISFEEMLRAEESLINTKISQMNIYAAYEKSLGQLAYINGDIIKFLNQYVD
jgi:hypothetical protein